MDALNNTVELLATFWRKPFSRRSVPYLFGTISLIGSLAKEFAFIPETCFSNTRNILNVYFVKVSWGWTLALLLPFIALLHAQGKGWTSVLRRLASQVVSTAVWFLCTQIFFYIEDVTGLCYESHATQVALGEFLSKDACKKAGYFWNGYDISGHSFILTYSSLVIIEEMAPMTELRKVGTRRHGSASLLLDALYVALNAMVVLWIWMFGCTSVYFHDVSHKLLGTTFGIVAWYLTYRFWYLKPFSPGLPLLQRERKQHA